MKVKMKEFEVNNSEEFEGLIESKDIKISQALVETILTNLKGRKRHIHAMSVLFQDEQMIFDVTVDREDFIYVLETHLPTYEFHELYEKCADIVNAIKYLKDKQK